MQAGRDRLQADRVWCGGVVWLEAIRGRTDGEGAKVARSLLHRFEFPCARPSAGPVRKIKKPAALVECMHPPARAPLLHRLPSPTA